MHTPASALSGLNLSRPPVAIGFLPSPPAALPRIERAAAGPQLEGLLSRLATIIDANRELERFHQARAAAVANG